MGKSPARAWNNIHTAESVHGNLTSILMLAHVCYKLKIHLVVFSSGVVCTPNVWNDENDSTDIPSSSDQYQNIKFHLEKCLSLFDNVLILRVMYPISGDGDKRCLISKLKNYKMTHVIPSCATVLPDLLPKLTTLLETKSCGIVNFVNKGAMTPNEILHVVDQHDALPVSAGLDHYCRLMNVGRLEKIVGSVNRLSHALQAMV